MKKIELTHHENTPIPEEVGIVVVQLEQSPYNKNLEIDALHLVEVFKIRDQLCYRFLNESKVHHIKQWPFKIWDDGK